MPTHKLTVTVLALCVVVAGMGVVWQVNDVKTAQESVETTPPVAADTSTPTPHAGARNSSSKTSRSSGTADGGVGARAREAEPATTGDPSAASDTRAGSTTPPDYDDDGISDATDQCPTRPETVNGFRDQDGCPDVVKQTGAS